MPYKDKEAQKEASKRRMQKMRGRNKGATETPQDVTPDVTQYPAILHALTDPEKREKLEKIYESLKKFNQAENVYYGCGKDSIPFDVVGDYLEAIK